MQPTYSYNASNRKKHVKTVPREEPASSRVTKRSTKRSCCHSAVENASQWRKVTNACIRAILCLGKPLHPPGNKMPDNFQNKAGGNFNRWNFQRQFETNQQCAGHQCLGHIAKGSQKTEHVHAIVHCSGHSVLVFLFWPLLIFFLSLCLFVAIVFWMDIVVTHY